MNYFRKRKLLSVSLLRKLRPLERSFSPQLHAQAIALAGELRYSCGVPTTLFTRENAAEMGRRGALAKIAAMNRPPPPPPEIPAEAEGYIAERLLRVRRQIASLEERVEKLILNEDPLEAASAIDRLCAAKAKLSEEERILAGRPLPGSHRPRQTSGPRRPSAADPLAE